MVRWRVGRRPKSHVCLDYDPYASMDHCEIQSDDGILRIVSLPGAKNGTWLNWREMPQARPQDLRPGDVVRVGQSVLVFQDR